MAIEKLQKFTACQKSMALFDLVVRDVAMLHTIPVTMRLRPQQTASADSTCADMEEGAGRWSVREYIQFLIIARGSTAEATGRYRRLAHWLPEAVVADRPVRCNEISPILTLTITELKRMGR